MEIKQSETRLREAARRALNEYRDFLKIQTTVSEDTDRHYVTSLTQVEAAKRVLWMED